MDRRYFVYLLASKPHGTLYVGVTNDLVRRVWEHRCGAVPGFTRDHRISTLVYFEFHQSIEQAILREKRVKRWRRQWKIDLIENLNPGWRDLYEEIAQG